MISLPDELARACEPTIEDPRGQRFFIDVRNNRGVFATSDGVAVLAQDVIRGCWGLHLLPEAYHDLPAIILTDTPIAVLVEPRSSGSTGGDAAAAAIVLAAVIRSL